MISSIIEILVMLNPFALFLYLEPIRKDLTHTSFLRVIFKATLISFFICTAFFFFGDFIFGKIFQINFESFRIFGGIIIFSYAYFFIVRGQRALIMLKEDLNDLASEIALPFMAGAGSISLSILLAEKHEIWKGALVLVIVFVLNFTTIFLLKYLRDSIEGKKFKKAFDKNMEVLLRLTGFFIGAIGINMMLTGISNIF